MKMGKPVIWTLHDSWPMTGGCHVRFGSEGFISGCGNCHELNSHKQNDITYLNLTIENENVSNK